MNNQKLLTELDLYALTQIKQWNGSLKCQNRMLHISQILQANDYITKDTFIVPLWGNICITSLAHYYFKLFPSFDMRKTQFSLKVGRKNWRTLLGAYMAEHSTVWLTSKMLVALCLNKVECFIRPLCKMFTMYTISKCCQCVILTLWKSIPASDL